MPRKRSGEIKTSTVKQAQKNGDSAGVHMGSFFPVKGNAPARFMSWRSRLSLIGSRLADTNTIMDRTLKYTSRPIQRMPNLKSGNR